MASVFLPDIGQHSKAQKELFQSCVIGLGMMGDSDEDPIDQEIRKALAAVSEHSADPQAKHFSMIAMAQVGGRVGSGAGDKEKGIAEMRKELLQQLARGRGGVKQWAGLAIGVLERALADAGRTVNTDSATALRSEVKDAKSSLDIGAFSIGAGVMGDLEAKEVLLAKLDTTRDPPARGFVAVSLGLLGAREAVEPIQEVVKSSKFQPDLLKSAAIGLGLLGDKNLVPELITMLDQARGLASQASIASALGFIGDVRSIDPLIAMLKDAEKTGQARGFAAVALGIVADKEPLPWNSKISININYRANTQTLTDSEQGTGILDIL